MTQTLVETVRVIGGKTPLWPLHVRRLTASAQALEIPLPELAPPVGGEDRVVRFALSTEGLGRSEREVGATTPIALVTSPVTHRGYPHKLAERAWLEAARTTSGPVSADVLLFDANGKFVEATLWAVGWWEEEALCFPPLALGGLPSVARARLGEMVRGGVRELAIPRPELTRRSLLACNAARGVVAVGTLDGFPMLANHRTVALAQRFWERPGA